MEESTHTLGLDENNSPVIIEYKRARNEKVINQGLYYLDWLLDLKAEFELMTLRRFGPSIAENIDWSSPRLLCIAVILQSLMNIPFNRSSEHRALSIQILYLWFLNVRPMNATTVQTVYIDDEPAGITLKTNNKTSKTVSDYVAQANETLTDRFENLKASMIALGDDVQMKTLKNYFAFKRIKNLPALKSI